jgi:hypothetical protein
MNLNCQRAAELCSHAIDRKLTRIERIALALHTLICSACRRYRRQIHLLRSIMRSTEAPMTRCEDESVTVMPDDARTRIAITLRQRAAM